MDTIGVIGAMEEEIAELQSTLGSVETCRVGGNVFHIGERHDTRIILLQCGIGKVNAAIGATLLITRYDPMCLLNTGSAGAVDRNLAIGDVVISSTVFHHDVDVTAFGYAFGQVPQLPDSFLPHDILVAMAENAARKIPGLNISRGVIATGDVFLNDADKIAGIRERFPAAVAVEMEAAAIAQTCHQFRKPFVVIRAISDTADAGATVDFDTFLRKAADNSARMVLDIIRELWEYVEEKEYSRMQEAL